MNLNGRLGLRSYRDGEGNVRPFTSLGVLGGFGRASQGEAHANSWNAGAFLELGAVYMFSSHLSLGGVGELSARYRSASTESESPFGVNEFHTNGVIVNAGRLRLLATVYF